MHLFCLQAEDGIRDWSVTGVQTCALPILTIDGRSAGAVTLIGRTENQKLDITFTTTGLLGPQPQIVKAIIDLSNDQLPAVIESSITGADLAQVFKILLPASDVAGTARTNRAP